MGLQVSPVRLERKQGHHLPGWQYSDAPCMHALVVLPRVCNIPTDRAKEKCIVYLKRKAFCGPFHAWIRHATLNSVNPFSWFYDGLKFPPFYYF
jgi:hypothetical protein